MATNTELRNIERILKSLLGLSLTNTHPHIITDTNTHSNLTGVAFHAWTDCVFDTNTVVADASGNTIVGTTLPAGAVAYLNFTAIDLVSGSGVCYQLL